MTELTSGFITLGLSRIEKMNVLAGIAADVPEVPEAAEHIAGVLDDMLTEAERRLGSRLTEYSFGGILFSGDYPRVWSPSPSDGTVYMFLSMRVLFDIKEKRYRSAYWTMAHEVVHLLSRTEDQKSIVLEEGIACWFQKECTQGLVPVSWSQEIPGYAEAEARFVHLLSYDADIVKKMRQCEPTISQITADIICHSCPGLPRECAEALSTRFDRSARA